jgi:hypothetical protein
VRCGYGQHPYVRRMTRFELKIPTDRRDALNEVARQSGVSSSDLVRLAINQLLEDRDVRLGAASRRHEAV